MKYLKLNVGDIIQTKGAFSKNSYDTDEQLTEFGWLSSPSCWDGDKVDGTIKFRRKIKEETNE